MGKVLPSRIRYSVDLCRRHPNKFFLFGDNCERIGRGGQAIIRGCGNAIGLVTKRSCSEYMEDGHSGDLLAVAMDMKMIEIMLKQGNTIVLPVFENGKTTLGCGLADLPNRAPALYQLIDAWTQRLIKEYPYANPTTP